MTLAAPSAARIAAPYTLSLLTGLYVAQGIPYGFFTQALPVLLRDAGLSLKAISLITLLFVPWTLKFLWGPFVDRVGTPRRWLLPLQLGTAAGAALLTQVDLHQGFAALFAAVFLFNLLASVQDVVTDALAVRLLDARQRGLANGIQVGAYRIGMVLGGGLLLYVYARAGWRPMFWAMSGLLLLCSLPAFWLRVPGGGTGQPRMAARTLALAWWARLRQPGVLGFIGLIAAYRFGDTMAASLIGPFMRDWGLDKESIALIKGTVGSGAGLAGAAIGGWAAWRFGRRGSLLVFGAAQTLAIALYALAGLHWGGVGMLWAACLAEHAFGGMATVALFTLMMDASDADHAGTDYSLYACAVVLTQGTSTFVGGVIGDAAGYVTSFVLATIVSGLGCVLLVMRLDRGAGPAVLRAHWRG